MEATKSLIRIEVFHKDYNLDEKDNLSEMPEGEAVFGIFGIVNNEPVNCRFVAETDKLREAVTNIFESPGGEGLKKFMQGPWVKMLIYELLPGSTKEDREKIVEEWKKKYDPKIDKEGEYPGYYES